jgi:hypothetical protein
MMVIGNSIDDREETQVLTAIKCFLCPVSLRGRGREGERERERFQGNDKKGRFYGNR